MELLIVIGLLGAIATLVLPSLQVGRTEVLDNSLVPSEMMDIRKAFAAFEADCAPTTTDKELIRKYGLEILITFDSSRVWSFPEGFDPDKGKGWRGPYLEQQGSREVNITDSEIGQPQDSSGTKIPVVHDPYHDSDDDDDEHYYRVLYDSTNHYLALVFVGENGSLETSVTSGTSFEDSFIPGGDDVIRSLSL